MGRAIMARDRRCISATAPAPYRIVVQGCLDVELSAWLNGMEILADSESQTTTLTGVLQDQSALQGVLDSLHNMRIMLIRVERLDGSIDAPDQP
jgi:hypothetical protein